MKINLEEGEVCEVKVKELKGKGLKDSVKLMQNEDNYKTKDKFLLNPDWHEN